MMFNKNRLFPGTRVIFVFVLIVGIFGILPERVSADPASGSISGVVYGTDGVTPLANIFVAVGGNNYGTSTCTNSSGEFTLLGLPLDVSLWVHASPPWANCSGWSNYVEEFWQESQDRNHATLITLDALSPDRIDINFTLDAGGVISGTVYQADGVTPIQNIAVSFHDDYQIYNKAVCTDVNGHYEFHGAPFDLPLRVRTDAFSDDWCNAGANYDPEFWQETPNSANATLVTVTSLSPTQTDIDFTLDPAGSVSGTVYQADGVTPIANMLIYLIKSDDFLGECTDNQGHYTIHNVPYNVKFFVYAVGGANWCGAATNYTAELWHESLNLSNASLLTVNAQTPDLTSIDFTLGTSPAASDPNIDVWYMEGIIEALDWPLGTHLTLQIDDMTTTLLPDFSAETDVLDGDLTHTYASFDLSGQFQIKPGMVVSISGGSVTKVVLVPPLTITEVNQNLDTVAGATAPNGWMWMYFEPSCCRSIVANGSGDWTVDYSVPGPEGEPIADIGPASEGAIHMPSGDGKTSLYWDTIPPIVTSSIRTDPSPTAASKVRFTVTFSEAVTGVDTADFALVTTGIPGASILTVSGSGDTYIVTAKTGSGNGTIRLDVPITAVATDSTADSLANLPYQNGEIYTINKSFKLISNAAQDGYILESFENSGVGGVMNKNLAQLYIGDNAANKQYLSILSFDTSTLPDNAVITKATLKFKHIGFTGTSPFTTHGNLLADVRKGAFSNNPALQLGDFNINPSKYKVLTFAQNLVSGWYMRSFTAADFQFINKAGLTQFRLRFTKDDNNDHGADFLKIYSGNAGAANRPQLVIEYYVP